MFVMKQNDTSPALRADLKTAADTAVNVTGGTVRFLMRDAETQIVKIDSAATIIAPAAGTVQYSWKTGDTDTVGTFDAEFEVTYSDGKIETFPNKGYIKVKIVEEIG